MSKKNKDKIVQPWTPILYGIHWEKTILGKKKKIKSRDRVLQDRYNKLKTT